MGKGSFILYDNDLRSVDYLTDSQIGKLFRALVKYRLEGVAPNLGKNPALNILYNQIVEHISINEEKYKAICEKRTEAANKRWDSDKSKNTNACKSIQKDANGCINDNDNENVNANDNVIVNDNGTDACGAKRENKRKNFYNKNLPRLLQDDPSYDLDAFTRSAIGLKYKKKEPLKEEKDNPCGLS